MMYPASAAEIKQAQLPHNVVITALFFCNLLMAPAVIALHFGMLGLLLPLLATAVVLVFVYWRSRQVSSWFVDSHWRLALLNSRWLLLGYAISAALIFLGWLLSQTASEPSMKHIIWTALTRIALLPTLAGVMVAAMTEASAISLVSKREVPDKLVARFPPIAANE